MAKDAYAACVRGDIAGVVQTMARCVVASVDTRRTT